MKLSLCTISFRHQLISFEEIVQFSHDNHFDGIELWGIHAKNLYQEKERDKYVSLLKKYGLEISMISDYLDISQTENMESTLFKMKELSDIALYFGAKRIRTFAGQKPSEQVNKDERRRYISHLRNLCDICKENGLFLLVETHPNTLADSLTSTVRLIEEVNHDALKINLDFLHLWENGDHPVECFKKLEPFVQHYHLKNISSASLLDVFEPYNVYMANGSRLGMTPLHQKGIIDYEEIYDLILPTDHFASLEWFGPNAKQVIANDSNWLQNKMTSAITQV
ncbi:sugar phosphate isomerase/epimerase family protein [Metabacillus fastidiosus]|uniref:sugar phosphate isomerase/epimerase family protein n=1 Tax=Metabacillus fastidiosus TaxID=1458 RepID=UPI003D278E54